VGAWLRPGEADEADRGLEGLVEVFGWYEDHLGPYPFGDRAGAVSVEWGPSAVGGMEHHPFWHVSGALGDPLVQAHEAAHGWFGDGVRLRCWEDMVLSEGVADYLAGAAAALQGDFFVWSTYRQAAEAAVARSPLDVARPDGCNLLEPASTWYFSGIPYKKGALFLRALAQRVGDDALLDALGVFFRAHVGRAAGVDDLLAVIRSETDYDPTDCADTWLRQPALPEADPCP
jgi:aminopeptidase N